jgi:putative oxidoreductase
MRKEGQVVFEQAMIERRSVLGDWVLRGGIAVLFVFFGAQKFSSDAGSEWVKIFQQIGFGQWFRYFTGVVEVVGGLLVLVPWTATAGLAILATTMFGAVIIDAFVIGNPVFSIFPGAFLVALIAVWLNRRD